MTERAGGSGVSGTESEATYAPRTVCCSDSKVVDGAKLWAWLVWSSRWVFTATDSSMTFLLAQTPKSVFGSNPPTRRTVCDKDSTVKETEADRGMNAGIEVGAGNKALAYRTLCCLKNDSVPKKPEM